eukprot:GHVT01085495.1.p1 GENE.GHVT01085495.1~~GHVT01085495.1.p1  ORF type:complete len:150 (-),score=29.61 GHVT01085495.1:707-1156(-)
MSPEEVGGGGSSSDGEDGKVMSKREARRLMLKEQQGARGGAKGGKEKMKRKPEEIVDESPETVQDVACDKTEGSSCQRKLAENQWVPFDPSKIITQAETVEYCPGQLFPNTFKSAINQKNENYLKSIQKPLCKNFEKFVLFQICNFAVN